MRLQPGPFDISAANNVDFPNVVVCFVDPSISELFVRLLKAQGHDVHISGDIGALPPTTKIITEAQFTEQLSKHPPQNCLVVGDRSSLRDATSITLCRPLTVEKIEVAMSALFPE